MRAQDQEYFQTLQAQRLPRVARAVGWLVVIVILSAGLFAAFVPWVQTAAGYGKVMALNPVDRLQEINALVSGRIQEWYVRDGDHVVAGDPIVRVADNDPLLLERLEAERQQVIAKLRAANQALTTAEIDVNRTRELFEKGLASRRDFEKAGIRVEELRARAAEVAAELNRAEINLSRQSVQTVRAPRDGTILNVNAGDAATYVSTGDVVATFVPDNVERGVELFIDGRDVALVRPGARVRLQFDGWPIVQFSGWPSVAVGTFGGIVQVIDPSAQSNGRFRVIVTEDPDASPGWPDDRFVRFGSNARGWVLLNTVTTGYEVWRRLNDFPPDLPSNDGQGVWR